MSITHRTKGIVLRTVPYGDTSVITTILTQLYGLQNYIVKGARSVTKRQTTKMAFLQPASLLDMVVYHNPMKQLNFIKEFTWHKLYTKIHTNVVRNAVALFLIELLQKCIKQPDENPDQYYFAEEMLIATDTADNITLANLPLFMAVHFAETMGLQLADDYSIENNILDLKEGCYLAHYPNHSMYCTNPHSEYISTILQASAPTDLQTLLLTKQLRKELLEKMEIFYQLHFSDFGKMRSMDILSTVLG